MASRTPSLRRCWTMSTTSPSQQGVEETDSEVVWMITEESAILVMSTSLLGKICILPSKEAHFMPARYKLYLVAQFVGRGPLQPPAFAAALAPRRAGGRR